MHREKTLWEYNEKPIYNPRRQASEETKAADTLISNSGLQDCEKVNACCLSHLVDGILSWKL